MSQKAWAKRWWFWLALSGLIAVFIVIGVVSGGGKTGTQQVIQEAQDAPAAAAGTPYTFHPSAAQQRAVRQDRQRIERQQAHELWAESNGPRWVHYEIKGSASGATITYTSTGDGTAQRDVSVVPQWRQVAARLARGDFAYISAQNAGEYGTLSCRILESTPYGVKQIAPPSVSSGAFSIVDCNGTVR